MLCYCVFCLLVVLVTLSVPVQVIDWKERLVSEMTYYVLMGTLNPTHSLTHPISRQTLTITNKIPPLRFADAPTYAKFSILMTSIIGLTTLFLSCSHTHTHTCCHRNNCTTLYIMQQFQTFLYMSYKTLQNCHAITLSVVCSHFINILLVPSKLSWQSTLKKFPFATFAEEYCICNALYFHKSKLYIIFLTCSIIL